MLGARFTSGRVTSTALEGQSATHRNGARAVPARRGLNFSRGIREGTPRPCFSLCEPGRLALRCGTKARLAFRIFFWSDLGSFPQRRRYVSGNNPGSFGANRGWASRQTNRNSMKTLSLISTILALGVSLAGLTSLRAEFIQPVAVEASNGQA